MLELAAQLKSVACTDTDVKHNEVSCGEDAVKHYNVTLNDDDRRSRRTRLRPRLIVVANEVSTVIPISQSSVHDGVNTEDDVQQLRMKNSSTSDDDEDVNELGGCDRRVTSAAVRYSDLASAQSIGMSSGTCFIQPALGIDWSHAVNHRIVLRWRTTDDTEEDTEDELIDCGLCREIKFQKSSIYSSDIVNLFDIIDGDLVCHDSEADK